MRNPRSHTLRGFAMPVVLLAMATIGAIAVSVISKGAAELGGAVSVEVQGRERLLIEAGLARGILALISTDDPVTESLRSARSVDWTFAGRSVTIELWPESAKLGLNAVDPGVLAVSLDQAIGERLGSDALKIALAHRGFLSDTDQLLPLVQRFTSSGARLREIFTPYGGQIGISEVGLPSEAGPSIVVSNERPIYTLHARIAGKPRILTVTVLVEPEAHRYVVLRRGELSEDDKTTTQ